MSEVSVRTHKSPKAGPAWWVYVLVALLSVAIGFGLRRLVDAPSAPDKTAGVVLEFDLQTLDGGRVEAADYEGKVLVIDFWATWCQPCRLQAEILEALERRYRGTAVEFLAINVEEPRDLVADFVAESPFPYPVALDPESVLSPRYGVYALPTVLIASPAGDVVYQNVGVSTEGELRRVIDEHLAAM